MKQSWGKNDAVKEVTKSGREIRRRLQFQSATWKWMNHHNKCRLTWSSLAPVEKVEKLKGRKPNVHQIDIKEKFFFYSDTIDPGNNFRFSTCYSYSEDFECS